MITASDLSRALAAVLPYAESRVEDMGASLERGGCKGCKNCPPHEPNTCPELLLAGAALTMAHAVISGDTIALAMANQLYQRAKHQIEAVEGNR